MFKTLAVPFTAKENVVLQTTAVAAATMPLACGFVGIVPALQLLYAQRDADEKELFFEPTPSTLFLWCLALGFFGVFIAPPMRKQTILREKLPFPSGTATAEIIHVLHGLGGKGDTGVDNKKDDGDRDRNHNNEMESINELAPLVRSDVVSESPHPVGISSPIPSSRQQAPAWRLLFVCFAFSASYTLLGNYIPIIKNVPIGTYLGVPSLTAWSWTLQPSPAYFGQGLIMGPHTTCSMLLGAVIGWGVLAPISKAKGWAPGPIGDIETGATGWLLWVSLAIMLADSAMSLSLLALRVLREHFLNKNGIQRIKEDLDPAPLNQQITWKIWLPGLLITSMLSTFTLAPMFNMPPLEPALAVLFSLLVSVLAIRALGETDLNPVSGIGKVSQLLFAIISPGNVVANLVAGAVAEAGAISAGDMMQDLKTGHLLNCSPKAQWVAQLVGTASSCIFVVLAWLLYSSAYEIPGREFPAPTARIWLDMAQVVNGEGEIAANVIPTAALAAIAVFFLYALKEFLPSARKWVVPSCMAAAIGMYITPNWTLPRVYGGLANYAWHRYNPNGAERYMIIVASGFVLGEGLMSIVTAGLTSAGITGAWCGGCPAGFCTGCH